MKGAAGLFSGLASGVALGLNLRRAENQDRRAEQEESRRQEDHALSQRIKQIGIGRMEKEESLFDQELQLKGAQLDYKKNELDFERGMQQYRQETTRLLEDINRAVTEEEKSQLQERLRITRMDLNGRTADALQRQTAVMWNVLKMGNKDLARKMFKDTSLVVPGMDAKDFQVEDIEMKDASGKPAQVKVLTVIPEGAGKPQRVPVSTLEALTQRYGAKYEKAGNNIVRIGPDGSVTPMYEPDQYMTVPEEGRVVNKRTGLPPAAGGVYAAGASGSGSGKKDARVDTRVKMGIQALQQYFGGRFEGGIWFPDPENKDIGWHAQVLTERNIRDRGMQPIEAANAAKAQAERDLAQAIQLAGQEYERAPKAGYFGGDRPVQLSTGEKVSKQDYIQARARELLAASVGSEQAYRAAALGPKGGGSTGYTGPTPWRK